MDQAQSDEELRQLLADFNTLVRADQAAILALLSPQVREKMAVRARGAARSANDDHHQDGRRWDLAAFLADRLAGPGPWQMTDEAMDLFRQTAASVQPAAPQAIMRPTLFDWFSRSRSAT